MDSHCFRYHGYAYDGIWTVARAIDTVEKESQQANESLVDFKYKYKIEKRITDTIQNVKILLRLVRFYTKASLTGVRF